jgi:TonB-dependent receptor
MTENRRIFIKAALLSSAFILPGPVFAQTVSGVSSAPEVTTADEEATTPADEIVVTGRRAADRAALENKKNSDAQVDQVRADDVGRLPDQNVAETLRRLPGISVANDQGEGRYLTVRGVSPDLLNVTLNGETAAAPEPTSRQVKLDDIPSGLIGAVTVVKTLTPDLDANAIAGSANIETLTAFDRGRTFASGRAAIGYNDINKSNPYEFDGTFGTIFGADRQFGMVIGLNYSKRHLSPQNFQAGGGNWEDVNGFDVPLEQTVRDYDTHRERMGAIANFDWRPTDDIRTFVRILYSRYNDSEKRKNFSLELDDDEITNQTETSGDFAEADGTRSLRTRSENSNTFTASTGGEFDIGNSLLKLEGSYTRAEKKDPHRDEWIFEAGDITGSYDLSDRLFKYTPDESAFDPTAYEFDETSYEHRLAVEKLIQARVDYRFPVAIGDESDFQVGAKVTHRNKTSDADSMIYDGFDGDDLTLDQFAGPVVDSIIHGRYPVGVTVDGTAADNFFDANEGLFELDTEGSIGDSLAGDFKVKERITAAYAMARLKFGPFTAIPGVRMEHTSSDYAAKAVLDTYTIDDIDNDYDTFGSQSYTDWFPGINLRYDVNRSLVLRGAITRAIGRPNYEQLAPTTVVNTGDNEVELGNPNLKPLYSTNFDAAVEYYIGRSGIVSAALFYKKIKGPIYQSTTEESGTFAGQVLEDAEVTRPVNADSAIVRGLELNAQMELQFLPSPLDGFSVGGSMTFVKSKAKGIPGRPGETLPLANQSDRVASAYLAFEKYGISGRIAYTYRSAYLLEPGEDAFTDLYVDRFHQWDAKIAYELTPNASVFIEGSNLNDAPYRAFQGVRRHLDEYERYGYSAKAGVAVKF